jgi:hypothetical protein
LRALLAGIAAVALASWAGTPLAYVLGGLFCVAAAVLVIALDRLGR